MKTLKPVVWLSILIVILSLITASVGLFWQEDSNPFIFTSVRGDTVEIYGQGLYRYDSCLIGAGNRGVDALILFLGIPLLVVSVLLYCHGSLKGGLLLIGVLSYFLYVYATLALGASYNDLFLVYVTLFSASFYAILLLFKSVDIQALSSYFLTRLLGKSIVVLLFFTGLLTLVVWLESPVRSLVQGQPPELLGNSTTLVTHALDLAIIVPALFLSGVLILRQEPIGYLIAFPLLFIIAMLGPGVIAMTASQLLAGISFSTSEIVGFIAGFIILGLSAIWFIIVFLRNLPDLAP